MRGPPRKKCIPLPTATIKILSFKKTKIPTSYYTLGDTH